MLRRHLRSWLWHVPVEQEVRDEIAHHVEMRTQELVARGMDPATARAEAERRFGDRAALTRTLDGLAHDRDRAFRRAWWLSDLLVDIRIALRHARQRPGFTLGVALTLALGIGFTTAIFSVVHAVVLAPFPYADADRVLAVYTTWKEGRGNTSVGNFQYMRERASTLDPLAAGHFASFNLAADDQPERILGLRATASWFDVFRIAPAQGRTFTADEDSPGRQHVAVITDGFWRRRFGGRTDALGQTIRLNDEAFTLIGVMPSGFEILTDGAEVIVPVAFTPERLAMYDEHYLDLYGRRRAEVTQTQVDDELTRVAEGLRRDHPRHNLDRGATSERFDHAVVGDYRVRLLILLLAVGLVLVIACGNAANLLLARLAVRSRELSIRAALGAGRGRILRQVLAESLVLALLGGVGGLVAAWWLVPILVAAAPEGIPRLTHAALNGVVLSMAVLLVVSSAIVVGILPAWSVTSRDPRQDLGDGKGAVTSTLVPWLRQSLIGVQAALVVIVLTGAALLIRSAINMDQVPLGFDTGGVLRGRVSLPAASYQSVSSVRTGFESLLGRLSTAPGVALAALDSQAPLAGGGGSNGLIPEGRPLSMESIVNSRSHFVTPDYFRLLRIPLREGRTFEATDIRSAPLVMIVNETLARAAFPGENPIGKRITCCEGGPDDPRWKTIVGVVADVRSRGPATEPVPEFYLPMLQLPDEAWGWVNNTMDVLVRPAAGDPGALTGIVRAAVRELDPSLPVFAIRTMDEGLRRTIAQARFNMLLMTLLALSGLVLAALGTYSVVAWLVAQRTREIGVRMALGASPGQVLREVVAHGLKPVALGLVAGVAGALWVGVLLRGQLFQVSPRDPVALAVVVLTLLTVAAVAAFVPARRATAIDPARALHEG